MPSTNPDFHVTAGGRASFGESFEDVAISHSAIVVITLRVMPARLLTNDEQPATAARAHGFGALLPR